MRELVYFVWDGEFIKIGRTTNLERRMRAIGTASPRELVLLGAAEGGQQLETELHQRFGKWRVRGEWFHAKQPLVNFIMRLPRILTE